MVSQGKYLWTKTEVQFNTGDPIVSYSVARMGMDGSGSVSSVAGVSPDETGNVPLTAADVGAPTVEELNTLETTVGGKQPTTNSLGTETNLADGDFIPFYDTSASANKKTLWSNIVAKIRTALFGSANGFLKADGSGNISAEGSIKTADLADGAVTRAKLAQDALYSPNVMMGAVEARTIVGSDVGTTFIGNSSVDYVITVNNTDTIPIGAEFAFFKMYGGSIKIKFGSTVRVGIAGNDLTAGLTVVVSEKFAMVAIKKIETYGGYDTYIVTGPAEVVT